MIKSELEFMEETASLVGVTLEELTEADRAFWED
jgi:hypothetical protein